MRVTQLLVLSALVAVATAQLSSGHAWQGSWTDGKRDFGGTFYICVDSVNNVAHGVYSGAGIVSGSLVNNVFKGSWYEAGYDTPFGTFSLTLSGDSFDGTWSYAGETETFAWSGSRVSSITPTAQQCLTPIAAGSVDGTYDSAAMCYHPQVVYSNTDKPLASAHVAGFGVVQGYSFNAGVSVGLSDFTFTDDADTSATRFRPESQSDFGPSCATAECSDDDNDDDAATDDDDDSVNTKRVVIGALVDDATFCGTFWEGFYNTNLGDFCFTRTDVRQPDTFLCGSDIVYINGQPDVVNAFDGKTTEILAAVQDALDNLVFPPVVVRPVVSESVTTVTYTTYDYTSDYEGYGTPSSSAGRATAFGLAFVAVALAMF